MPGKGLLERLAEGPVIGDGGFVFALEKRGYVKAGPWTPEATVEHPEAGGHVYGILAGWPGHVQTNRTFDLIKIEHLHIGLDIKIQIKFP